MSRCLFELQIEKHRFRPFRNLLNAILFPIFTLVEGLEAKLEYFYAYVLHTLYIICWYSKLPIVGIELQQNIITNSSQISYS
jgi:hypothetical protein